MPNAIRTLSRRRLLALLAALALLGFGTPATVRPTLAAPAPQHRWYYSGGVLVGEAEWDCDLQYTKLWGVTTSTYTYQLLDCSGGPIES